MLVSAAVIRRDGKILAGQRRRDGHHALKWEFPGGKVEPGETPRQTLVRELREELSIEAEIGAELARDRYEYPGGRSVDLLFFAVERFTGEPVPSAFEQIRWVEPEVLPSLDFLEGDVEFVQRLASGEFLERQPHGAKTPSGLKPAPQVYDRIAPVFWQVADRRRAYLDAIDRIVISQIPRGSRSLLDVGAGDGSRGCKIGKAAGIGELVLLEPSAKMRKQWPPGVRGWGIGAEELCSIDETFDTIVCLWNVLGHISPANKRAEVLRQFSRLLSPSGMVFLDVNHRYNMREYSVLRTVARMVRDCVFPNEKNGDVVARWNVDGTTYATSGHVFTDREFRGLVSSSGLRIAKRFVVDYETGQVRKSGFSGNLLYCLTKGSANFGDGVSR